MPTTDATDTTTELAVDASSIAFADCCEILQILRTDAIAELFADTALGDAIQTADVPTVQGAIRDSAALHAVLQNAELVKRISDMHLKLN
jgi:hypothetical protein